MANRKNRRDFNKQQKAEITLVDSFANSLKQTQISVPEGYEENVGWFAAHQIHQKASSFMEHWNYLYANGKRTFEIKESFPDSMCKVLGLMDDEGNWPPDPQEIIKENTKWYNTMSKQTKIFIIALFTAIVATLLSILL
jgi:hypothetical protein